MVGDASLAATSIPLRAFKYKHADKTILLVRIPSYIVPNNNYANAIGWLAALLKDNVTPPEAPPESLADTPADVVVIDETHNPGGSVPYVSGLARLFTSKPIPNFVQANHADRHWIAGWLAQANAAGPMSAGPSGIGVTLVMRKIVWVCRTERPKASPPANTVK